MTDWNKVQSLKDLRLQIINDEQIESEFKAKLVKMIDTQIQQQYECVTRCQLKPDTVIRMQPPLEFEGWWD